MSGHNTISRVVLRNYKSIRDCDVPRAITFLVGPNGAGKSNFVEALRFLSYGLSSSLEQALDDRSGFRSILHRGAGRGAPISIRSVCRRFTRLTNGFSKKIENHEGGVAVYYMHHFVRIHQTFRITPAMAAGDLESHLVV